MKTLLLMLAFMVPASPTDLDKAVTLSRNGDHEASEEIMKKLKDNSPTYRFYRMINAFKLNKKEESIKWADTIINAFSGDEIPQRYLDLALICKADAEIWKNDADDLSDIAREMDKIKDRLDNKKGGAQTQKQQKQVLARLDKMIKDKEDAIAAAAAAKAKAEEDKLRGEGKGKGPMPAQDTQNASEEGTGKVDQKKVKQIADLWGKLSEKERAKAMVELQRNVPKKDRAVIEAYFRELARKKK
jgi:hypothetical protein